MVLWRDVWTGIWLVVLGIFIHLSARIELAAVRLHSLLDGVVVADIMVPPFPAVASRMTVQQVVTAYFVWTDLTAVPVEQHERHIGVITVEDVRQVPAHVHGLIPVGQVMTPLGRLQSAQPQDRATDALKRIAATGTTVLSVVHDGTVVGLLDRERILQMLRKPRYLELIASERT